MDLDQLTRPSLAMEHVNVLRDHTVQQPAALELDEREVGVVGLAVAQGREAFPVEGPEALGLMTKYLDVGDLHRVDVCPQASARGAEVWNPRRH